MIIDTTDISIIRESEFGIYDTLNATAVYAYTRLDGRTYLRLTNGETFLTSPKTIIIERGSK